MKILIIGNGSMYEKHGNYFVNSNTAIFLNNITHELSYSELTQKLIVENDINSSNISNLNILPFYKHKFLSSLFKLTQSIIGSDFTYVFYPGVLSKVAILISVITRTKFGLYVRGEINNNSFFNYFILKNAYKVITVSEGIIDSKFSRKTYVCHPMIKGEFQPFKYLKENNIIKFLFVGRIEREKGIFEMIDFLVEYSKSYKFSLDVVGDGKDKLEFLKKVKYSGLENYINMHGNVDDYNLLERIYFKSDIFLFFSHTEGFPRVLYEAVFGNCLIITSDVGGISSVFRHNHNCLFISENLVNDLKKLNWQKINFLIKNSRVDVEHRLKKFNKRHEYLLNTFSI